MEILSQKKTQQTGFFSPTFWPNFLLLALIGTGIYFFHGFTVPILAATIITVSCWPLYTKMLEILGGRKKTSATIALLIAIIFLVIPLGFMAAFAMREAIILLEWAIASNQTGVEAPIWVLNLPYGDEIGEYWNEYLAHPGMVGEVFKMFGAQNIGTLYKNVLATGGTLLHILLNLVFIMMTLFFLFKDGSAFTTHLDKVGEHFYPNRWQRYSRVVPVAIRSTVLGMGFIAVGEGIILGVAYWVAGVPSPVILGIITGFMALIPGGAPLSFTLVSAYLVAIGATTEGILLWIWGCSELFIVDKFLRPRLVGKPMKLPFLPTFFGLVGGVKTMGFLGLFIGPALMAILVMIWREIVDEVKS